VRIDKETELGEDCDPDIVRAENEPTMVIVRFEDGMHEPVGRWHDVTHSVQVGWEGSSEKVVTTLKLFKGCLFEDCEIGVLAKRNLEAVVFCKRLGRMIGGAE